MTRLYLMTILTEDSYFWLFGCSLIIILLILMLINWLLKTSSEPACTKNNQLQIKKAGNLI